MLKTNEYFDGKVKSIALETREGPATVGVMDVGEYEFGTSTKEIMRVVSGQMHVRLPGNSDYVAYEAGKAFEVAANEKFQLRIPEQTAYLCLYK